MNPKATIQGIRCTRDRCESNKFVVDFITVAHGKVTDIGGECAECDNYNHIECDENTQQFPSFTLSFD